MSKMRYVQRQRLEGRRLRIFGFGDLVMQVGSKWKVPVFMLNEEKQVEQIEFLFSTIGDLRLGQTFHNGLPIMPESKNIWAFSLPPSSDWEVKKVSDCLKYCPYFYQQKELINQNLFVFTSGKAIIYLPQLELAKILFFKKAILTRYVFQPTGLNLFAYDEVTSNNETKITFLPDVPMNILDDKPLLKHLSWIYNQPDIKKSFASCFNKMGKQNSKSTPNQKKFEFEFEFDPPNLENVRLNARCSQLFTNHYYVDEILGLEELPMPLKNTVFIHPHANSYYNSGGSNGGKTNKPGAFNQYNDYDINIDSDDVGETRNVVYVDTAHVQFSYSSPATYEIDRSVVSIGNKNKKGAFPVPVSEYAAGGFDESLAGGKQKQLEFKSISNLEMIDINLYKFREDIKDICEINKWEIAFKFISLPRVNRHKFPFIGASTRQAILIIIKTNGYYYYLVEVQTDDDRALSTLIFKRKIKLSKEERDCFFYELIVRLIKASGHWKTKDIDSILKQFQLLKYLRFKHPPRAIEHHKTETRSESWKQRLVNWIMSQDML